jgi:murein L,D-transpeptidase YafK
LEPPEWNIRRSGSCWSGSRTERELRVLVPAGTGWKEAARYRVLGASGGPGPKLRQGDQQVPEGFYEIESLNPNSLYHLAIRVNYPNAEDRKKRRGRGQDEAGLATS